MTSIFVFYLFKPITISYTISSMVKKKIGILVTSNTYGGIGKLCAMMANDLSNQNNIVNIYIPILPYYTFYFKIFKKRFYWIRKLMPHYIMHFLYNRKFCFEHLIDKKKINLGLIRIKFIIKAISKKEISNLDCVILNGIADVIQYQNFNNLRKIYLVNQIEEVVSGHRKLFQKTRNLFKGDVITHCNFMKRKLSGHVDNLRIVPNPISYGIWKFKNKINFKTERDEILIYWKSDRLYDDVYKILKKIRELRPKIKITIFARSIFTNTIVKNLSNEFGTKLFFNLKEKSVAKLYLTHTFLLYPNRYEDFGMPPVEALACGCIPILNPKTGAADMYSENNFNSIHLTYDVRIDVKNILSKLENNQELIKLRKNAVKNIKQFNPKNYGAKILN
jgi:glycosyltransferase involved in cell wall biosynthesis